MPESPDEAELSDNDEAVDQGLIESLRKLSVSPQQYRYHGKSSGLVLIRTAVELRNQQLGRSGQVEPQERLPYTFPVSHHSCSRFLFAASELAQVAKSPKPRNHARIRRLPSR